MDEILYTLCRHNVSIMQGWHPFSATAISKTLGVSIGKIRYHLTKLKKQGLVNSFYEGGMTEDGDVFCYWGWKITEKAFSTEEYKKAFTEERDLCKKCFSIDMRESFDM